MPAPSPPAPLPPTTCRAFRTWVRSRKHSPCSAGVAMVRATRTPNTDWPAVALAAGQAYSAAGLIPSRLSWVWTCPPLACCRRLLPNPSRSHPAGAARGGARRAIPRSAGRTGARARAVPRAKKSSFPRYGRVPST